MNVLEAVEVSLKEWEAREKAKLIEQLAEVQDQAGRMLEKLRAGGDSSVPGLDSLFLKTTEAREIHFRMKSFSQTTRMIGYTKEVAAKEKPDEEVA